MLAHMGLQHTEKQRDLRLQRWYHFFLDVCKTAKRFDYGIACHPDQKQEMMDMMEQVAEDEMWQSIGGELPPLVVHRDVPPGQYMFVDKKTMKVLSNQAALQARSGLGRFSKLWTPGEGMKRI